MTREELTEAIAWHNGRITGSRTNLKSRVLLEGPPDKYTDEELQRVLEFAERRTREDKVNPGSNLIYLDKDENSWIRFREDHSLGTTRRRTLDEILRVNE